MYFLTDFPHVFIVTVYLSANVWFRELLADYEHIFLFALFVMHYLVFVLGLLISTVGLRCKYIYYLEFPSIQSAIAKILYRYISCWSDTFLIKCILDLVDFDPYMSHPLFSRYFNKGIHESGHSNNLVFFLNVCLLSSYMQPCFVYLSFVCDHIWACIVHNSPFRLLVISPIILEESHHMCCTSWWRLGKKCRASYEFQIGIQNMNNMQLNFNWNEHCLGFLV